MTLAIAGAPVMLAAPGDEVTFAGEADVAATAVTGASRDLNIMVSAPAGTVMVSSASVAQAQAWRASPAVRPPLALTDQAVIRLAVPSLGCPHRIHWPVP